MAVIISLLICVNYVKGHYANDSYAIMNQGYYKYATGTFLTAGRPIACLLLLVADMLNLSVCVLAKCSFIIGILISCSLVMLIRKMKGNFY